MEPYHVDCGCRQKMLQMRLGQTDVVARTKSTTSNRLLMRAFDAGPGGVLGPKRVRRLPAACRLEGFVFVAGLQADDSGFVLRFGTVRTKRTGRAIRPGKAGLEDHPVLRIRVGEPGDALFARRARHDLLLPVHDETPLVETLTSAGLPTGVVGYRTDDGHAVIALAFHENARIRVALVDQVLTRQQIALRQRLMDHLDHVVVRCRRGGGLDVDDQVRQLLFTRLWPSARCHRLASTVLTLFGEGAIAGLRPWARATPSPARSWGREWGAGPGGKMTFGDSPRPSPSAPRIGREVRKLFTFISLDTPRFRRRTAR